MKRRFNVTGSCSPQRHYMVRLDDRLKKIKQNFVDYGSYFVINRGRQYGKTTTLKALEDYLSEEYIVVSLDFQMLGTEDFADEARFSSAFLDVFIRECELGSIDGADELLKPLRELARGNGYGLKVMFMTLSGVCGNSRKPIVLMIDEVDSASNNQVFIEFLAQLRSYYLKRDKTPIFHSVILAGVYDIKNLKLKLRPDSEHQYNSPWNVAAKFNIDMSFSVKQISSMLAEYEEDQHTGMDIPAIADEIYQYTSGYPVLVSSICKCIDEELPEDDAFGDAASAWSKDGVAKAVEMILKESSPLFESLVKQLDIYKDLRDMIEDIIYRGRKITFSPEQKSINLGLMFGYLKEENGHVTIANRMFEMCLLNLFMAEESRGDVYARGGSDRIGFIRDGMLDMELVLRKFLEYFTEICGDKDERFIEKQGRKIFLIYLKPIINGTGNYYIEAETRDERRTDIIVDYKGEQFIVELKIWHGNEYNERGEQQLTDYLDYYQKDKGYMLSFNFNKNKETGVKEVKAGKKTIVEGVV